MESNDDVSIEEQCDQQIDALERRLALLPAEEIVAFETLLDRFRDQAYHWRLWRAAYMINGGCSDDGFEYFRCWLIAQGERTYREAVRDADALAEVVDPTRDDYECERLLYAAAHAYEVKTGREMPDRGYVYPELAGEKWAEDDLDAMFPRLAALYEDA